MLMFLVRLFPCDNKPCVNGATCANDDQDVSLYHCNCTDGYSGKNCQGREKLHLMFHYRHTLADYKIVFYFSSSRFQQNRLF